MNASIIPIFIPHAGCPHDCVFCDQKRIAGRVCAPAPENVRAEVLAALERRHKAAPQVAFYGGSFTAIPVQEQCAYLSAVTDMVEDGRLSGVRVSTRPDFIDADILARLKAYGVTTVELGIQSFCDEVLNASGRGHDAAAGERAAKCVKEHGMELVLQLMAGLPQDSRGRALASARRAAELSPDGVRIYPVAVIEGTKIEEHYKCGKYTPLTVEEAVDWSADMLEVFIECGIPVIRIGLNTSETLEGSVVAGAYHPALGELVKSRVYLRRARRAVAELSPEAGDSVVLSAAPGCISQLCGQHSQNREAIKSEFSLSGVKIEAGDEVPWQVRARLAI